MKFNQKAQLQNAPARAVITSPTRQRELKQLDGQANDSLLGERSAAIENCGDASANALGGSSLARRAGIGIIRFGLVISRQPLKLFTTSGIPNLITKVG